MHLTLLLIASLASTSSAALFGWGSDETAAKAMTRRDLKIVCYYTNWAQYRPKPGSYFPESLDAKLCTHVIYAFAKIDENYELKAFEWNDESTEWAVGMYQKVANKKKENPGLKVMLAVGGWNHGSMPFSNMVSDEKRRKNFVAKTIEFLKQNNFDGLDLDWEYPAHRDTEDRPDDKIYFTILCKELYADFRRQGLLLSAAVAAGSKIIDTAYEIHEIHKYLDFINLMAYDLHGAWENVTGHNAPLYPHLFDRDKTFNVDWAVRKWISRVPAEKLVLGLSAYGRSFTIKSGFESCPLIDTPASAAGTAGTYSRENGFLTYYEVCDKILNNKWKYVYDEQQRVPYAYSSELDSPEKQTEWVGFDDVRSIEQKVKYIKEMQLGGAMLWSLDMDDFDGSFCQQGKYPILRTINHFLIPAAASKDNNKLPNPNVLYGTNNSRPVTAASRIYPMEDVIFSNGKYFNNVNVFGLMQNDVDQIYKFCQCKNGTHKVFLSEQTFKSGNFIFIIDCNIKRVYHDKAGGKSRNSDTTDVLTIGVNDNDNSGGGGTGSGGNEKNKSIWSIFGISSSAINSFQVDPFAMTISRSRKQVKKKRIVCYLTDMMMNKFSSRLTPSQIDPFMCTHIIFSMVKVDETSHDRIVPLHKSNIGVYNELVQLKSKNTNLKVLVSLGSYRDGTSWLIRVAEDEKNRRSFVRQVILFLRKHQLDGLEINWNVRNVDAEYYGSLEDMEMSRECFTNLCADLSTAFKPFNLTLAAQVSGLQEIAQVSYDIPKLQEYLDFASVVSFDFYEIPLKQRFAFHHDLLYVDDSNKLESQQTSQSSSLNYWITSGFSKDKLHMSIGLYARTYQLFAKKNTCNVGSVVNREGLEGPRTGIRGILSYYEMCINLKGHWKKEWLSLQSVPYACSSVRSEMAFYEDEESVRAKLAFVNEQEYGGVAMWSLEMDDFSGLYCPSGEKFPLHHLAKSILHP